MILDRKRLQDCLTTHGIAVGNKVLDVVNNVLITIDKENSRLFLTTTDLNAFVTTDYGDVSMAGIGDDDPTQYMIRYKQLTELIKASTTDTVEFDFVDDNHVKVKTNGTYKFALNLSVSEFPAVNYTHSDYIDCSVPELQMAWDKVAVAVSKDVTKVSCQGVNYDGSFAATDNRRFAMYQAPWEYEGDAMLMPLVFGSVLKNCKNSVKLGLNEDKRMVLVTCEETGMAAAIRLLQADFLDYQQLLNMREFVGSVTVGKAEMLGAIQRMTVLADEICRVVKVTACHNGDDCEFTMDIENKDTGSEPIEVTGWESDDDVESPGQVHTIAEKCYMIDNLADGIAAVSDENVTLSFAKNGSLWIEEDQSTYVLSEIRG